MTELDMAKLLITPEWYLSRLADTIEDKGVPSKEMVIDALRLGASEISRLKLLRQSPSSTELTGYVYDPATMTYQQVSVKT
jgi:hypothetical protein